MTAFGKSTMTDMTILLHVGGGGGSRTFSNWHLLLESVLFYLEKKNISITLLFLNGFTSGFRH
jgi:hypothetical protein